MTLEILHYGAIFGEMVTLNMVQTSNLLADFVGFLSKIPGRECVKWENTDN
jgi:hypothetical protein